VLAGLVISAFIIGRSAPAAASDQGVERLREGGAVVVMRHARAPGVGDPPDFRLNDCATQRNLSEEGREQAKRIGLRLRAENVRIGRVLSSRWCRALDTARLAFGEAVEPFPALDSFFANREAAAAQTRRVQDLIDNWRADAGVLVLVTHQVNITALTGLFPSEGEILVLTPGSRHIDRVEF
jgi:phosphohistidine phosphatase SixA